MENHGRVGKPESILEMRGNTTEKKRGEMVLAWWNGGGKLVPRLNANPGLQKYMSTEPDIFVYGEAMAKRKTKEMNLPGYNMIIHKAQIEKNRRGLVVYYKECHAYTITKDASSKTFDIIWLRKKTSIEEIIFGFFYAPGAHHTEKTREKFYDELRKGIDKYAGKKIHLMGDSNARLGKFSGDRDIHGNIKTNNNKALLIGLLEYTGMKYLNRIYAYGKPTYELWGRKRSIIDVAMSSNLSQVKSFKVNPQTLGCNAQTCHKIIELTLGIKRDTNGSITDKVKKFRYCSEESVMRVRNEVARKCKILRLIRELRRPSIYNYRVLSKLYHNAKVKCIGFSKGQCKKAPVPMTVKTVQAQVIQVTAQIETKLRMTRVRGKNTKTTQELIERLQRLEKMLYTVWEEEKQMRWAKWVRKLNNLDHSKATRAFYAELNRKKREQEHLGPIINAEGQLSTSLEECMKNWRSFYQQLYSKGKIGNKTMVESHAEANKCSSTLCKEQEEALDADITMNEVVDAIFSLRTNTAAGSDSILARDIHELLDTSKQSENWKNVEMLRILQKMLQNMWNEEKVPPSFKETVLRPFLKDTEKRPTDPSNYRPVALLNIHMKIYEHIIKERLVAVLEKK